MRWWKATPRAVSVSGCVQGTTSCTVTTRGTSRRTGGTSMVGACTTPAVAAAGGQPRSHSSGSTRLGTGRVSTTTGRASASEQPRGAMAYTSRPEPTVVASAATRSLVYRAVPPGTRAQSWAASTPTRTPDWVVRSASSGRCLVGSRDGRGARRAGRTAPPGYREPATRTRAATAGKDTEGLDAACDTRRKSADTATPGAHQPAGPQGPQGQVPGLHPRIRLVPRQPAAPAGHLHLRLPVVFKSQVPKFGLFLMSGLLIWTFFTMGVRGSATSILGNAGLVKKVPFPHSALPLSAVGFAGVQVALQYAVLIVALFVFEMPRSASELLLLVPALLIALTMTIGLGFFVAASTVSCATPSTSSRWRSSPGCGRRRHLSGHPGPPVHRRRLPAVGLLHQPARRRRLGVPAGPLRGRLLPGHATLLLPSDSIGFYLGVLGIGFVVSAGVLALGLWQFKRHSADFAEDL